MCPYSLISFRDINLEGAKALEECVLRSLALLPGRAQPLANFTLFSANRGSTQEKKLAVPRLQKCFSFVVPSHTWETNKTEQPVGSRILQRNLCKDLLGSV